MRFIARALSVVLHPLWMPTFTIVLCLGIDPRLYFGFTKEGLRFVYGTVFVMTALFPLTSAVMMRRNGLISDLAMPLRSERIPAYLISLLYYGMCYYLLRRISNDPVIMGIFAGAVLALLITLLITLRWKISAHMVGIGGLLGALLAVMIMDNASAPMVLVAGTIMAGALGSARLLVSDHTPAQVYAGTVLGGASVLGCVLYGLYV